MASGFPAWGIPPGGTLNFGRGGDAVREGGRRATRWSRRMTALLAPDARPPTGSPRRSPVDAPADSLREGPGRRAPPRVEGVFLRTAVEHGGGVRAPHPMRAARRRTRACEVSGGAMSGTRGPARASPARNARAPLARRRPRRPRRRRSASSRSSARSPQSKAKPRLMWESRAKCRGWRRCARCSRRPARGTPAIRGTGPSRFATPRVPADVERRGRALIKFVVGARMGMLDVPLAVEAAAVLRRRPAGADFTIDETTRSVGSRTDTITRDAPPPRFTGIAIHLGDVDRSHADTPRRSRRRSCRRRRRARGTGSRRRLAPRRAVPGTSWGNHVVSDANCAEAAASVNLCNALSAPSTDARLRAA